jgi:uncharacterized membrane protein YphA (DoxX/SURF4 family)
MEFNSMSEANEQSHHRVRAIVSLVASILVALTLLLSGSGKVFGYGDMPGQTMQFIGAILPDAWLTPQLAFFISQILIANNAWYISQGDLKFTPCECFGIWEKFIGTFTHVESLYIDIVLFALALTVVLIHPADFFSSPPWLAKLQKRNKGQSK